VAERVLAIVQIAAWAAYFGALGYAALRDVTSFTIPNVVSLVLLVAFGAYAVTADLSWNVLLWHLVGGLLVFAVGAALFFLGVWGGGDAKLLAVVAVWAGWSYLADLLLWMAFSGGVLTLLLLLARRLLIPNVFHGIPWLARLLSRDQGMPYGVAIAIAGMAVAVLKNGSYPFPFSLI